MDRDSHPGVTVPPLYLKNLRRFQELSSEMDSLKCVIRCLSWKIDGGSELSSDVWQARIDLCVDKESKTYWIMLRLRSDSGDEKKHMSILIPKTALSDALQRASNFEEKGFHERAEEPPDLPEAEGD